MTKFDATWAQTHEAERKRLSETGMFREEFEHASCGVGLVVAVDGKPRREVVQSGISYERAQIEEALRVQPRRDPKTNQEWPAPLALAPNVNLRSMIREWHEGQGAGSAAATSGPPPPGGPACSASCTLLVASPPGRGW